MSQFDFGNLESPLSGSNFINANLEPWRDALHTLHKGPSTPSYAVAGMMWIDDSASPWVLNIFDGTDNISVGTVDPTTNTFTPSGVSQDAADISVDNSGFQVFNGEDVQEVLGEVDSFADSLGTAASEDVGTSIGDVVQLEDVGGNPGLPAVDGSKLTGINVPVITDWVEFTPTFQGASITGLKAFSRRVGDSLQLQVKFTASSPTSNLAQMTIGYNGTNSNVTIDGSKLGSGQNLVGMSFRSYSTFFAGTVLAEGGNQYLSFGAQDNTYAGLSPAVANIIWSNGGSHSFYAEVPISGW